MSNITVIIGNIGRDPELTHTSGGKAKVKFSVADQTSRMDPQTKQWVDGATDWVPVIAWERLAEHAQITLRKGDRVIVQGRYEVYEVDDANAPNGKKIIRVLVAKEIGPALSRHFVTNGLERPQSNGNYQNNNNAPAANNNSGGGYQQPQQASDGFNEQPF